ncbi:PqqD family protein [Mesorhizobium sp. M1D.F.Ca.ET.184.01.1.1]|nr:PqqD family protein [Mesorhizobium sp. M1D.F.Ca.ET.231.01.1.1]TGP30341.1 PqqD family protein [Mesorhizobium sp. M1D.F.Ca.ET.234.01.1.1]TGS44417.1 PqqD family protein [Mesorhizobium sp. M1D.F.Ca.ET.184.01.1.1]TGS60457.1 PqqD family protein [Mesorhizobium sp. M1D.F.Ca.ET.183.01.1.1]
MKGQSVSTRFLEQALPQCSADDFDGEIVAINLDTGIYYSIKDSAALIWHDLADGHSVESLLGLVQARPDLHEAVEGFVNELVKTGLMRPAEGSVAPAPPRIAAVAATMPAPVLEPFGDMQDLLLLDPVHEVDEDIGWPKAPA